MQSISFRYLNDPQVHALVDSLENYIYELRFTPSEIRECAMLAAIHFEQRRTRPFIEAGQLPLTQQGTQETNLSEG